MKRILFLLVPCLVIMGMSVAVGDPLDDLLDEFNKDYNAIKPPSEYSSVNSDYKLGQAALGTLYTTKALGLLYRQNQELLAKYDEMLRKYDEVIRQNKEIIRILSVIAKSGQEKSDHEKREDKGGLWSEQ